MSNEKHNKKLSLRSLCKAENNQENFKTLHKMKCLLPVKIVVAVLHIYSLATEQR